MKTLNNKLALVTGGNSGLGYAIASELISRGARVIITGRRKEAIKKAAAELGAVPFVADQSNMEDTARLQQTIAREYGPLDILVLNAGITGALGPIETASTDNFDEVMNTNFKGAYFTLSHLIPQLSDGASVVVVSSIVANTYKPNSSVYQASKAALNSIAKTAAAELAPRKIRVNLVSPGPHKTEIMKKAGLDEAAVHHLNEMLTQAIPLKAMGNPEHMAQLVAFLCEDAASFITGAEVVADGGMTL
jgi:NAD(P)-dependent dehydrogenase (short-subunit alcohol dehydrogenase family)